MLKKYVFFGGVLQNTEPCEEMSTACSMKTLYMSTNSMPLVIQPKKGKQLAWSLEDICQEFRKDDVWKTKEPSELTVKQQMFQWYFWLSSTVYWGSFCEMGGDTTKYWNKHI